MIRSIRPIPAGATAHRPQGPFTLAIDIGGSGLKASVLDQHGNMIAPRFSLETLVGRPL